MAYHNNSFGTFEKSNWRSSSVFSFFFIFIWNACISHGYRYAIRLVKSFRAEMYIINNKLRKLNFENRFVFFFISSSEIWTLPSLVLIQKVTEANRPQFDSV